MRSDYSEWLIQQEYQPKVIDSRMSNARRVEGAYGDLEDHFIRSSLQGILEEFEYSTEDARRNKPNPSKVIINGDLRTGLGTLKSAVGLYRDFLASGWKHDGTSPLGDGGYTVVSPKIPDPLGDLAAQKLSLERDMQKALRRDIRKLGHTLSIIDDGGERFVKSGRIDITCEDSTDGALVVVELKAGKADSRAVGQILGYMGDLMAEEGGKSIRGILVAHEFDIRTKSAARTTPQLALMRYSVEFRFEMTS